MLYSTCNLPALLHTGTPLGFEAYRGFPHLVATIPRDTECPSCPSSLNSVEPRREHSQPKREPGLQGLMHPDGPTLHRKVVTLNGKPTPLMALTLSEVNYLRNSTLCYHRASSHGLGTHLMNTSKLVNTIHIRALQSVKEPQTQRYSFE